MAEPTIYLRGDFASGFTVAVEPAVPGFDFDTTATTYREARTFARGIRLHRAFELVDETTEAANG